MGLHVVMHQIFKGSNGGIRHIKGVGRISYKHMEREVQESAVSVEGIREEFCELMNSIC